MNRLEQLVTMSRYAGERFDLVQAGGGNASVKHADGTMRIKASGCLLSEVELQHGHILVDNAMIVSILNNADSLPTERSERDAAVAHLVQKAVLDGSSLRPSIETLLHSLLPTYTLHTHPLIVNAVTCRADWLDTLQTLFSDALFVPYRTPGIELALELKQALERRGGAAPNLIFLQNHGLIVSSDIYEQIEELTEEALLKLERFAGADLNRYRLTTALSRLLGRHDGGSLTVYLSEDQELARLLHTDRALFFTRPFCPDRMVFCGAGILALRDEDDHASIEAYQAQFHELPRVLLVRDQLYFVAKNVRKAREAEESFKFHVMALKLAGGGDICYLPDDELAYLGNWDAEKYRRNT